MKEAIFYFGLAPKAHHPASEEEYENILKLGLAAGYLPHPDCDRKIVTAFLKDQQTNPNSTFWKTWNDITSRSQLELYIHAILHYITTYGSDYKAEPYVPNSEYADLPFKELKPILPATGEEIAEKCLGQLRSGIALSEGKVKMMVDFIVSFISRERIEKEIDSIANREAKVALYRELKTLPSSPIELLRLLVYQLTDSTLLIKSPGLLGRIARNVVPEKEVVGAPDTLDEENLKKLASIFYRFKPIFLVLRNNPVWRPVINRIRRLARVYHKPLEVGVMESLMDSKWTKEEFDSAISREFNVWKLCRALAYLRLCIEEAEGRKDFKRNFYIRNGKIFTRSYDYKKDCEGSRLGLALDRKDVVEARLSHIFSNYRASTGKTTVALPADINLMVPQSEKQFMGDIPFGSYFDMARHNFVGIYWRNEWGTHDYDLSFIEGRGRKLGWNASYTEEDGSLIFSGDMTDADPEATEMFYCKAEMPDGCFMLNRYNGERETRVRIFFGQQEIENLPLGYMVDPGNIKFKADIFPEKNEVIIAGVKDNRIYLFYGECDDSAVSRSGSALMSMVERVKQQLTLKGLLELSGYRILSAREAEMSEPDIDLRHYTKDQLVDFFTQAMTMAKNTSGLTASNEVEENSCEAAKENSNFTEWRKYKLSKQWKKRLKS